MELGSGTFFSVTSVVFQDLPELVTIQVGCCCCYGDNQSTDIINHVQFKSIYDMELFKISQLPHKKIYSLKIVSDNLNEKDCESFNDQRCWNKINKLLKENELL